MFPPESDAHTALRGRLEHISLVSLPVHIEVAGGCFDKTAQQCRDTGLHALLVPLHQLGCSPMLNSQQQLSAH